MISVMDNPKFVVAPDNSSNNNNILLPLVSSDTPAKRCFLHRVTLDNCKYTEKAIGPSCTSKARRVSAPVVYPC